MSLLTIERVTKCHVQGRIERLALSDVSLEIEPGELTAILGPRRSGRTTLARVAAGIECPDGGSVCFDGKDLARCRDRVLGREIGYAQLRSSIGDAGSVLDQVADGVLAERVSLSVAWARAREALSNVGVGSCAELSPRELDAGERVRVALARAIAIAPRLLVVDEPTNGVDLSDRDPILRLLRQVANGGVAVLMTTGDGAALSGVDRVFSLDQGELRGGTSQPDAAVIPLRRSSTGASAESRRG